MIEAGKLNYTVKDKNDKKGIRVIDLYKNICIFRYLKEMCE